MFESIVSMLLELSRSLPRIEAYIQLLPTPQLHQALRNVYDHFVDFCIAASDILETRSFGELSSRLTLYANIHWQVSPDLPRFLFIVEPGL